MPWTLALSFIKGNWLKSAGYVILLGVVAYGVHRGYDWVYDRGVTHQLAIDTPVIAKAHQDRDTAIAEKTLYVTAYDHFVDTNTKARQTAETEHQTAMAALTAKLTAAEKANTKLHQDLTHAIASYIPPSVDSAVSIPLGAISLYNQSIGAHEGNAYVVLAGSTGFLANAPSGVTPSQFAGVVVDNNSECLARGEVIAGWQEWYWTHKAIFDKALAAQSTSQQGMTQTPP